MIPGRMDKKSEFRTLFKLKTDAIKVVVPTETGRTGVSPYTWLPHPSPTPCPYFAAQHFISAGTVLEPVTSFIRPYITYSQAGGFLYRVILATSAEQWDLVHAKTADALGAAWKWCCDDLLPAVVLHARCQALKRGIAEKNLLQVVNESCHLFAETLSANAFISYETTPGLEPLIERIHIPPDSTPNSAAAAPASSNSSKRKRLSEHISPGIGSTPDSGIRSEMDSVLHSLTDEKKQAIDTVKTKQRSHGIELVRKLPPECLATVDGMLAKFFSKRMDMGSEIRLKFLLVQNRGWDYVPQVFQTILSKFSHYGLQHAGLLLGGKIVDWTDWSLATPRPPKSSGGGRLAVDIGSFANSDPNWRKFCQVVVRWNTTKSYNRIHANCQTFVSELLQTMSIKLEDYPAVVKYLDELKETGTTPSAQIQDLLNESLVSFTTHEELDKYAGDLEKELAAKNPPESLEGDHPDFFQILKGLDRIFWLQGEHTANCPFGLAQSFAPISSTPH